MDLKKLADAATPKKLGAYLAEEAPMDHMDHHKGHSKADAMGASASSLREEDYKGHKIEILTRYKIEVDGKKVKAPFSVDGLGRVHCHSLPNYLTPSAVDMVKMLIDNFPLEFGAKAAKSKKSDASDDIPDKKKKHKR